MSGYFEVCTHYTKRCVDKTLDTVAHLNLICIYTNDCGVYTATPRSGGTHAGSVEALLELAERARLIKPSTCHHDDDLHFTGRMVSHYENGVEVSRERMRDNCCFGTLPEFIELLTSCGYQVIQGVNHG